ncbi:MAG: CoA transferase [Gammaproteobacteria bacterium]|nr:CoA transferase [Gammaproteobacteria bacterium]
MHSILGGIRVVEAATFVAGPAAGTIMADFGADVIHIEPPGIGDAYRYLYKLRPLPECAENYPWLLDSRNKKSITLNLKRPAGRAALYRLLETADVFITNYQPSVLSDLGVRFEDIDGLSARLIYAHVTGYGDAGAEVERPGYDATAWWARSGMMDLIRPHGGELALSAPGMGDHPTAVALFGAIMLALYRRERTGQGGKVSTSLMANGVWANGILAQAALCGATFFERGTHAESPNPLIAVYQTLDERHFSLVMVKEAHEWDLFCTAIARPELGADPRFESSAKRREHASALVAILDQVFATKTLAEWSAILDQHRVTFGVVQKSEALPSDAQMLANGVFPEIVDLPGRRTVDSPINVDGTTKIPPQAAPALGAHTREVLQNLGYSDAEITAMAAD